VEGDFSKDSVTDSNGEKINLNPQFTMYQKVLEM